MTISSLFKAEPVGSGGLDLKFWWKRVRVEAGPIMAAPRGDLVKINMAAELNEQADADYNVDCIDFSTPDLDKAKDALAAAWDHLLHDERVYVGCMGGRGRTGLFLALMAKIAGEADPVGFVRQHYFPHAVETQAQKAFVEAFDARPIRRKVKRWVLLTGLARAFKRLAA